MCVLIDDREDARLLLELKKYGVDVETIRLDFGDCMFTGRGPDGQDVLIGIERKKLPDLVACMQDRRLSGWQIRGMRRIYDRTLLVVEGLWRPSASGAGVEVLGSGGGWVALYHAREGVSYRQLDAYLQSLGEMAGVTVIRTSTTGETAAVYVSRYHWWRDKPYEQHHAHDEIYCPPPQNNGKLAFREPGLIALMAAQLPGVDRRAFAVEDEFDSVVEMVCADEKRWRKVKGIGVKTAREVVRVMRGASGERANAKIL